MNSSILFKYASSIRLQCKRFKYKKKWAINSNEKTNTDHALNYFDVHYDSIFHRDWRSIRLALLSQPKHSALINNFCEHDGLKLGVGEDGKVDNFLGEQFVENTFEFLQNCLYDRDSNKYNLIMENENKDIENILEDHEYLVEHTPVTQIISESDQLKLAEMEQMTTVFRKSSIEIVPSLSSGFAPPSMLKALTFHEGDVLRFPPAKQDTKSGKLLYYLMDASSILPVLCLDLFPGCSILDMCSAPGGKMMVIVQTMLPDRIVCLDKSYTRMQRLKDIVRSYLPQLYFKDNIIETHVCNAVEYSQQFPNQFDRVLVDVPCFSDRHVLTEDSNLFVPNRREERLALPTLQLELLINGINSCKENGVIVYSTCTLLPSQNDAIVAQAIDYHRKETCTKIVVEDMGYIARVYEHIFKFSQNTRYGLLVLPHMTKNFGPMYFSKLRKLS